MSTTTKNGSSPPDVTPADVWRQKAIHTVTGHTGAVARIRIPGIATLLPELPEHLASIALLDLAVPGGAAAALREMLDDVLDDTKRAKLIEETNKLSEYERRLVAAALVEPELTYEEISSGEFPEDDFAMILEIVQRRRAYDARGVRIGVEPLDRWEAFHREHGLDEEGCEHCQRLADEFSSVHVGAV